MRDVVYVLANNVPGDELRYSLRSLRNLPHRNVAFIGGKPKWATNVTHYPFPEHPRGKWWSLMVKIAYAATLPLSDVVYVMADDFFVTKPVEPAGPMYTNTLEQRANNLFKSRSHTSLYANIFQATFEALGGGLNFQQHVPQVLERAALPLELILTTDKPLGAVSLAANRGSLDPVKIEKDYKVVNPQPFEEWKKSGWPYLSTRENSFKSSGVADYLKKLFPEPSPYERT